MKKITRPKEVIQCCCFLANIPYNNTPHKQLEHYYAYTYYEKKKSGRQLYKLAPGVVSRPLRFGNAGAPRLSRYRVQGQATAVPDLCVVLVIITLGHASTCVVYRYITDKVGTPKYVLVSV